jgi:hypothetical protein
MGTRSSYLIVETNIYKAAENENKDIEEISDNDFKYGFNLRYSLDGKLVESRTLCNVYFQCDGYPQGHPMQSAEWLASANMGNGIPIGQEGLYFNGASCLAAAFVEAHKQGAGGVYIHHPESFGKAGEDYLYKIEYICDYSEGGTKTKINFECLEVSLRKITLENGEEGYEEEFNPVFSGLPSEFVRQYKREQV